MPKKERAKVIRKRKKGKTGRREEGERRRD
jgi:hypothetical protein